MTVLSPAIRKAALIGFPTSGRYSYITLLMDFAEWGADLPEVQARIARLATGYDFAVLFRDIIATSKSKSRWCWHPEARLILRRHYETLAKAWETTLSFSPDRAQLTLEYLADSLKAFDADTRQV